MQIACGTDHVLALTIFGTVFGWGNGQHAQLGRRIIERRKLNGLSPERLALRRIVYIAAGAYHSFAISEDGRVYAWGLNSMGQTGLGPSADEVVLLPTEITSLSPESLRGGRRIVEISGGEHHTLFLTNDGVVYGCGRCDGFELGLPADHPALLDNKKGLISEPVLIPFPPPPTLSSLNPSAPSYDDFVKNTTCNPISKISVGTRHNLAVSRSGHAYSWGIGQVCELGLGPSIDSQATPSRIQSALLNKPARDGTGMFEWNVEDASAGGQHCILVATPRSHMS